MSAIFQRPLCEMGRAYEYAFRAARPDPGVELGGPCDDRPRPVDLCAASADPADPRATFRAFLLCPEHRSQLERVDVSLRATGRPSRFRSAPP